MTNIASLPWDTTDAAAPVTTGSDLHARATSLAHAAMEAVANQPFDASKSDYARAQADYARRAETIRAENARNHVTANNARAEQARLAKAERQVAHQQRNAEAKQAKADRKLAKAA